MVGSRSPWRRRCPGRKAHGQQTRARQQKRGLSVPVAAAWRGGGLQLHVRHPAL